MQRAIVLRGRLSDPRHIELDEPVEEMHGRVEVTLRPVAREEGPHRDVAEVIASLRGGTRSKEEIDAQLASERDWGER